jgi:Uma2 family endonuclease
MIRQTSVKPNGVQVAEALAAHRGEPVWEIAHLYPPQGEWHESEYLALNTNRLIDFDHGYLEFLPMPTISHQLIVAYLYELLRAYVLQSQAGKVLFAPLPVRLWPKKYREPDIVFLSAERLEQLTGDYPEGADVVMEVVSGSDEDRERDLVTKREEYALAGIAEYWIVDPEHSQIIVLRLDGERYMVHGEFETGEQATSALLDGFSVNVDAVFAAASPGREQ